jgi:hypothetical protein
MANFAERRARQLRAAANLARAKADALKAQAAEAEDAAFEAECEADEWEEIAAGNLTPAELHDPSDEFSFG